MHTTSKIERQEMILKIIGNRHVHNQDELQTLLQEKGMTVTQATLSRDIKALKINKSRMDDGSLCYVENRDAATRSSIPSSSSDGVVSIEICGNIGVIKTHPSFANTIAFLIDNAHLSSVAGTIAGDDTVMVVFRDVKDKGKIVEQLSKACPDIENKIMFK